MLHTFIFTIFVYIDSKHELSQLPCAETGLKANRYTCKGSFSNILTRLYEYTAIVLLLALAVVAALELANC